MIYGESRITDEIERDDGRYNFQAQARGPFSRRGHEAAWRSFVDTTQEGFKTQTLNDAVG
jgi:hypothetical protein